VFILKVWIQTEQEVIALLGSGRKHPFSLSAHEDEAELDLPELPSDDPNPFSPVCNSFATPCRQIRDRVPELS
jgi:hypothetical protein